MALEVHCVDGKASSPAPSLQSIPAFCADNAISRSLLYGLVKEGRGPRLTKLARRTLISSEAAAEWRARMERETEQVAARPKAPEHPGREVGRAAVISRREAA